MDLMEVESAKPKFPPLKAHEMAKPKSPSLEVERAKLKFPPLKAHEMSDGHVQYRTIPIPPHRMTPLRKVWEHEIYPLITDVMKIDVCVNRKNLKRVELRTTNETPEVNNLNKCADFIEAFARGFDVKDAEALLRIDEMCLESFEIEDVKKLRGEHLSRAIGRLSGKGGKTKFAIENATRTRIVIADKKIHLLGTCTSLKVAKDSLSRLILGSPAAKVYSKLRVVTARAAERF